MDREQLEKLIDSRIDKKISSLYGLMEEQNREKMKWESIENVKKLLEKRNG